MRIGGWVFSDLLASGLHEAEQAFFWTQINTTHVLESVHTAVLHFCCDHSLVILLALVPDRTISRAFKRPPTMLLLRWEKTCR